MTWFLIGGAVIGASIGAGTTAARGGKGWDIAKGGLMGGVGGAATGGMGGALAGGAAGAGAGAGVTAMGEGLGGGALGSGAIGTSMTASEMSASALPGVTAGSTSGGLMGGMTSMLEPKNLQNLNGLLGGGGQQQQQRPGLPPAPQVNAQNMGGIQQQQPSLQDLIVSTQPQSNGALEQWLELKRRGLV